MKYMILEPKAYSKLAQKGEKLGFKVIPSREIIGIDPSVAGHPDMQIVKVGDTIIAEPGSYEHYKKLIPDKNIICGQNLVQGKYPEYTAYNVALSGEYAIHNFKYTDPVVLDMLAKYKKINVKQGYTKCSVLTTDAGIITSDNGIIRACEKSEIECVGIAQGEITLKGKENGFIGGASGYSDGVLYFTGDVKSHPDYEKIKKFTEKNCIEILCLSNDKLADIGSIIFI